MNVETTYMMDVLRVSTPFYEHHIKSDYSGTIIANISMGDSDHVSEFKYTKPRTERSIIYQENILNIC